MIEVGSIEVLERRRHDRTAIIGCVICSVLTSGMTVAQTKAPSPAPGQSEYAPGHQPGPPKESATGQKMQKHDDPKQPGASEYAPGHQGKKAPSKHVYRRPIPGVIVKLFGGEVH